VRKHLTWVGPSLALLGSAIVTGNVVYVLLIPVLTAAILWRLHMLEVKG
jgi:hypothetical protein